ncbi:MAG: hypothetical protein RLZZ480_71 [Candidatus Parcubacteria bacterium]|jgi:hypothetical protein
MFDKKHIENILRINGLATSSPDEEIRSVLLSARFNNDEVETAMMVLKENTKTNETHVDGLHKVFRTDDGLKPSEISQLLGIDVNVDTLVARQESERKYSILQVVILWAASMIIAVTAVLLYMYSHHIGFFHPTSASAAVFKKI